VARLGGLIGAWRSLVARGLWVAEVPGSNPGAPTLHTEFRSQVQLAEMPLEVCGRFPHGAPDRPPHEDSVEEIPPPRPRRELDDQPVGELAIHLLEVPLMTHFGQAALHAGVFDQPKGLESREGLTASIRRRTVASPAMAEVRPLEALHYDLNAVSSLADVTAPPYDVIDSRQRAELIARSPFNVVQIDLPEAPGGGDPYDHAAETLEAWTLEGVLAADREPALWALTQEYTGPDGVTRTRHGFLARVRVTEYGRGLVRPHERTQPGPKEDRLRLTEATRHNLSPIFSLYPGNAWRHIEPHLGGEPWGEVADPEGTVHRIWRIADPAVHDAVTGGLADAELLIADGHHRYETARTYADAIGGDGPHRYTLMCLVSLEDPGLTIFGTNRLLSDLDDGAQERLAAGIREHFEVSDVTEDEIDPAGSEGIGVFGYADSRSRGLRLRLADTAVVDEALAGMSEAYRRLDAVILEELILKRTLGMSDEDISAKRGLGYVTGTAEALRQLDEGTYQAAFFLRPTPVEQVRAVAAEGETMPSKSTYFFPKVLTGMVFNPLS
jgi:uncharacterized protein (DUF1015 family)